MKTTIFDLRPRVIKLYSQRHTDYISLTSYISMITCTISYYLLYFIAIANTTSDISHELFVLSNRLFISHLRHIAQSPVRSAVNLYSLTQEPYLPLTSHWARVFSTGRCSVHYTLLNLKDIRLWQQSRTMVLYGRVIS